MEDIAIPASIGALALIGDQVLSPYTYPTLARTNGNTVGPVLNAVLMGGLAGLGAMYLMSDIDKGTIISAAVGAGASQAVLRPLYRSAVAGTTNEFLIGSEGSLMTGIGALIGSAAYTYLMEMNTLAITGAATLVDHYGGAYLWPPLYAAVSDINQSLPAALSSATLTGATTIAATGSLQTSMLVAGSVAAVQLIGGRNLYWPIANSYPSIKPYISSGFTALGVFAGLMLADRL